MNTAATRPAAGGEALGDRARTRLGPRVFNRKNGLRLLSLAVVLSVWELWGSQNRLFASHPTAIFEAATEIFFPQVLPAFATTLTAMLVGMVLATPIGMAIGFAMARIRLIDVALTPYVYAIYATPRIALIPVLVLWLGIHFELRVTIVALGAVFPVIVNTYSGAKNVDAELLDTGRAFMARSGQLLRTVVIPATAPFVFAGIRIGLGRAVSGVIVAEMTAALTGIGRLLISHAKYFQTAELYVGIITLGIVALLLTEALARTQRRLTPWASATETGQ